MESRKESYPIAEIMAQNGDFLVDSGQKSIRVNIVYLLVTLPPADVPSKIDGNIQYVHAVQEGI